MYQKGDYIIYGSKGVCEVMDVSTLNMNGVSKDKLYYFLRPYHDKNGRIFTPVDSDKTTMRKVLKKEEAERLIEEIPSIGSLWVSDERQREANYKQAVHSGDCREWVRVIKTLWLRNQQRLSQGKKTTAMDRKYFKIAEDNLYAELAVSLGLTMDEVREYVSDKVKSIEDK